MRGGIYFRIESTDLKGRGRQVIYEGINSQPFAVAIKNEHLFFTDLRGNGLWRLDLDAKTQPMKINSFVEKPMGLIAKKQQIRTLPECQLLEQAYENYTKPVLENFEIYVKDKTAEKELQCINGKLENGVCKCSKGYSGVFCELSLCHNYCLVGSCHLTREGYPYCHCPKGLGGPRCERDCEGYCLNGGSCSVSFSGEKLPTCSCPKGYRGSRCEESDVIDSLCDFFCSQTDINTDNKENHSFCK